MNRLCKQGDTKLLIVSLLLVIGLGCSAEQRHAAPLSEPVRDVQLAVAQRAAVPEYVEAIGTVRAGETSQIASQLMGRIVRIDVHEGDRVRGGQALAAIDDTHAHAEVERATAALTGAEKELAAAESQLTLAQTTFRRYQTLLSRKSVSPQEFDEVSARLAAAEARRDSTRAAESGARAALAQARTTFEYTRMRAPFAGTVTARLADVGTLATPGMPLLVVESRSHFRLEAAVNEAEIASIRLGDEVNVVIDALPKPEMLGKVSQIVPAADPASRTFLVKLELPASESGVRSGLFGRARFRRGQREAIVVPDSALVQRGQLTAVYVVGADQVASLRFVTLGQRSVGGVEVLTGVSPGERLIADAGGRDLGGRKIEVP